MNNNGDGSLTRVYFIVTLKGITLYGCKNILVSGRVFIFFRPIYDKLNIHFRKTNVLNHIKHWVHLLPCWFRWRYADFMPWRGIRLLAKNGVSAILNCNWRWVSGSRALGIVEYPSLSLFSNPLQPEVEVLFRFPFIGLENYSDSMEILDVI